MQENFYREGLFEYAHSFCELFDSVFALVRQVSIQGETQGDLQRHILWIHECKGLQCELCNYRPTQKSAMTKHIELIHRQSTKYKEPSLADLGEARSALQTPLSLINSLTD